MFESLALRAVHAVGRHVDPKKLIGLSKYLFIKSLLDQHDIELIVDVGGNVGQFASSMRKIGYRGQIISFEPVAAQFARISRAAGADPKWSTHNVALGDRAGTMTINVMASSVFSSFRRPSSIATKVSRRPIPSNAKKSWRSAPSRAWPRSSVSPAS